MSINPQTLCSLACVGPVSERFALSTCRSIDVFLKNRKMDSRVRPRFIVEPCRKGKKHVVMIFVYCKIPKGQAVVRLDFLKDYVNKEFPNLGVKIQERIKGAAVKDLQNETAAISRCIIQ